MAALYRRFCEAQVFVASGFLLLLVLLIFLGGVARMAGYPLNWTGDVATALFAWACFFCADIAWRRNSLMAVEILTGKLPQRAQVILRHVNYAVIVAFLVYVVTYGVYLSWISRTRSFQGMADVSYSWVTMAMPVGGLMLLVTTLLKVRDELRGVVAVNVARDVV